MTETIQLTIDGPIAEITLDRPPLNILDLDMLRALAKSVKQLADREFDRAEGDGHENRERHGVRVVLVRSANPRAFSAGVAVEDHTPDKIADMLDIFHGACRGLMALSPITIAVVSGHCLGGGMELAASCDLILATDSARFGQPEIELGCYPPLAAALYPALIGPRRTLEMLASGRIFDAAEAERIGLVSWRVADEQLEAKVDEVVSNLAAKSGAVMPILKRAVAAGSSQPFDAALSECERLYLDDLAATEDMNEGLDAFMTRRAPEWRHS